MFCGFEKYVFTRLYPFTEMSAPFLKHGCRLLRQMTYVTRGRRTHVRHPLKCQSDLLSRVTVLREKFDPASDCEGNGCAVVRIFQN